MLIYNSCLAFDEGQGILGVPYEIGGLEPIGHGDVNRLFQVQLPRKPISSLPSIVAESGEIQNIWIAAGIQNIVGQESE